MGLERKERGDVGDARFGQPDGVRKCIRACDLAERIGMTLSQLSEKNRSEAGAVRVRRNASN